MASPKSGSGGNITLTSGSGTPTGGSITISAGNATGTTTGSNKGASGGFITSRADHGHPVWELMGGGTISGDVDQLRYELHDLQQTMKLLMRQNQRLYDEIEALKAGVALDPSDLA